MTIQTETFEEQFRRVCVSAGLKPVLNSKIPCFKEKNGNEGIELQPKNIIVPFWIKDMEKVYGQPVDSKDIQNVYDIFQIHIDTPTESKPEIQEPIPEQNTKLVNNLPSVLEGKRNIVFSDLEDLKKMSTFDRILLFQKTIPAFVEYLDKKKERPYVKGNIMKMEANIAFLYKWSSHIDGWQIEKDSVACWGSIRVDIDGTQVTVAGCGIDKQIYKDGDINKPVLSTPEMMKNACTDMKKKCLADLGFNGDVYRGEV